MKHLYQAFFIVLLVVGFTGCNNDKDYEEIAKKLNESPGGSGSASCLKGTWYNTACGNPKGVVWYFGGSTGYFQNEDCNKVCEPIRFNFKYTVTGNTCQINYTSAETINCGSLGPQTPNTPRDDSFTFSCNSSTLTVSSGSGSTTFTR